MGIDKSTRGYILTMVVIFIVLTVYFTFSTSDDVEIAFSVPEQYLDAVVYKADIKLSIDGVIESYSILCKKDDKLYDINYQMHGNTLASEAQPHSGELYIDTVLTARVLGDMLPIIYKHASLSGAENNISISALNVEGAVPLAIAKLPSLEYCIESKKTRNTKSAESYNERCAVVKYIHTWGESEMFAYIVTE